MASSSVSVILPTLDAARFCRDALDSVAAQTLPADEVIVVDAASTDSTVEIARSYGARVVSQEGRGIASAWNLGIEHARGEFLAFLSADDRWAPEKLERQLALMRARPELGYCISLFRYELEPGATVPRSFNRALLGRDLIGRIMETLLARRGVFDTVGRFDPSLRLAEDVDWYARAKDLRVPSGIVPEVLLRKRVHGGNISLDSQLNGPELLKVLRRTIQRQRDREEISRPRARKADGPD